MPSAMERSITTAASFGQSCVRSTPSPPRPSCVVWTPVWPKIRVEIMQSMWLARRWSAEKAILECGRSASRMKFEREQAGVTVDIFAAKIGVLQVAIHLASERGQRSCQILFYCHPSAYLPNRRGLSRILTLGTGTGVEFAIWRH